MGATVIMRGAKGHVSTDQGGRVDVAPRPLPGLVWPRLALPFELIVLLAGDLLYEVTRALAPRHQVAAFEHARRIVMFEPSSVLSLEEWLRHVVATAPGAVQAGFSAYYAVPHLTVTATVLAWLWWRRPQHYAYARTVLFLLTITGLVVFWLYPVAPPRLAVPGAGTHLGDLLLGADPAGTGSGGGFALVNPYAAFPSLHVAWAAWCAWAVWTATGVRTRWAVWLYPVATTIVVIATANHYVIDVLGGIAVLAATVAVVAHGRGPAAATEPAEPAVCLRA